MRRMAVAGLLAVAVAVGVGAGVASALALTDGPARAVEHRSGRVEAVAPAQDAVTRPVDGDNLLWIGSGVLAAGFLVGGLSMCTRPEVPTRSPGPQRSHH